MLVVKRVFSKFSFAAKMSQIVRRDTERAIRVQENINNHKYAVQNEAKLRQKVTVESQVEQLEKQLRQEIAQSLKRSENKVTYLIKKAEQKYKELKAGTPNEEETQQYNILVSQCEKARWEFMIHRQAVGFTIKNYELVTTIYRIPPRIM